MSLGQMYTASGNWIDLSAQAMEGDIRMYMYKHNQPQYTRALSSTLVPRTQ